MIPEGMIACMAFRLWENPTSGQQRHYVNFLAVQDNLQVFNYVGWLLGYEIRGENGNVVSVQDTLTHKRHTPQSAEARAIYGAKIYVQNEKVYSSLPWRKVTEDGVAVIENRYNALKLLAAI